MNQIIHLIWALGRARAIRSGTTRAHESQAKEQRPVPLGNRGLSERAPGDPLWPGRMYVIWALLGLVRGYTQVDFYTTHTTHFARRVGGSENTPYWDPCKARAYALEPK